MNKMKDYSKVKYVKPSVDGLDITKGKVYECIKNKPGAVKLIFDDVFCKILIHIPGSDHLNGARWIPCDENGKEIEL